MKGVRYRLSVGECRAGMLEEWTQRVLQLARDAVPGSLIS